ncbi:hypothetical protein SY83_15445 [Paenibacillus swuensis]|uniref:YgiT-type zinc finger domain-containing protein n=1 Tax=Paenibacillus swuensis TaxID=1178515 RepID=A0A172TK51_9BACL|nr:hypothetical protein [Paenibacillus swuensis]ANE47439.1 hypothetical protein SY83_15445 [Paenibacillus swuensis]
MQKPCACGHVMSVKLRTVIYSKSVEIEHVPVYSCEACKHSEIFQEVKEELKQCIEGLGSAPAKQVLQFNELNELAHIIYVVSDKEYIHLTVRDIVEERINQLLDLLLISQSAGDVAWTAEIRSRLAQISRHAVKANDLIG